MAEISGDGVTGSTPRFLGACRPTRFGKSIRYFVKEKISRGFVSEKFESTHHGLFRVQFRHIKFGASDKAYREKRTNQKVECEKRNDNWRQNLNFIQNQITLDHWKFSKPSLDVADVSWTQLSKNPIVPSRGGQLGSRELLFRGLNFGGSAVTVRPLFYGSGIPPAGQPLEERENGRFLRARAMVGPSGQTTNMLPSE